MRSLQLLACLSAVACGHARAARPKPPTAEIRIDFSPAEAWLACRARAASGCERASAATHGGRIAEAALTTFGSDVPPPPPAPTREAVAALLAEMRRWPDVSERVMDYLPARIGGHVPVFVVANGHPFGDAYVRSVREIGDRIAFDDSGQSVIVLNVLLIAAQYGATAREQAANALGVLDHEVFHQLFARYRHADPAWQKFPEAASPARALQMILLDEGVAHFIEARVSLERDGFPTDRSRAALASLGRAVEQLASLPTGSQQADGILRQANQGRYWDKFGSMSGMLFSYGVYRAFGFDGIRHAVRCGPGDLLRQYDAATRVHPELPPLPAALLAWCSSADLCVDAK